MKKLTLIALAASIALMFSACGPKGGEPAIDENDTPQPENDPIVQTEEPVFVEEQVLVDEAGIKITATDFEDGFMGPQLRLLIENDTEQNIIVQARNSSVNGYMIDANISSDIAAGKKSNDSITFFDADLEKCGIETIADMEFSFIVLDSDTWETYLESAPIQIETAAKPDYKYTYNDSGELIYEENGIKIVSQGIISDDSVTGPELRLYIENESGNDITIQSRDVSVNGFMTESLMSADVINGKRAVDGITFYSSSLDENGITDISSTEFSLIILDADYNTIAKTDAIALEF